MPLGRDLPLDKNKLILVGDRVLVRPESDEARTPAGLILPAGAVEKQPVQGGWIEAVGPGTPLPDPASLEDEPWKDQPEPRYLPMQAAEGDYAVFFRKAAVSIELSGRDYLVVPQGAILLLVRDWADD